MKPTKKNANSNAQSSNSEFYIGEAINVADNGKVTPELVKERTATLNNNPRDNSLDE